MLSRSSPNAPQLGNTQLADLSPSTSVSNAQMTTAIQNAFKSLAGTKRFSMVSFSNFRPQPLCSSTFKQAGQPTIFSEKYKSKGKQGARGIPIPRVGRNYSLLSRPIPVCPSDRGPRRQPGQAAKGTAPTLTTTLSFPLFPKYLTSYGDKSTLEFRGIGGSTSRDLGHCL